MTTLRCRSIRAAFVLAAERAVQTLKNAAASIGNAIGNAAKNLTVRDKCRADGYGMRSDHHIECPQNEAGRCAGGAQAAARFIQQPYARDAARLRTWDDRAKTPGAQTHTLKYYETIMVRCAQ